MAPPNNNVLKNMQNMGQQQPIQIQSGQPPQTTQIPMNLTPQGVGPSIATNLVA
jgi:hypothetical protein